MKRFRQLLHHTLLFVKYSLKMKLSLGNTHKRLVSLLVMRIKIKGYQFFTSHLQRWYFLGVHGRTLQDYLSPSVYNIITAPHNI